MKEIKLTNEETGALCSQLSYLLHAGMGNADALNIIAEDEPRSEYKKLLLKMADEADTGKNLSEILDSSGCVSESVPKLLAVGEVSGKLQEALDSLAETCENRASREKRLKSALVYPAVLMLVMLAVIAVILIYVLPIFNEVYAQLGGSLTGIAGGLLSFGKLLGNVMPVLLVIFCAAVAFLAMFSAVPSFREKIINGWKKGRGNRGISEKISVSEFAEAMSMAVNSGMSMEEALREAAKAVSGYGDFEERLQDCLTRLEKQGDAAPALRESKLLPAGQCRILEAGIKGGAGEKALEQIASKLKEQSDDAVENMLSAVEPAMVIISSLLVGFVLLAVMLPLVNIMSAIG